MPGRKTLSLPEYNIVFDRTLTSVSEYVGQGDYSSITVLVDENTRSNCLPVLEKALEGISFSIIEVTSGEQNKSLQTCEKIWAALLEKNVDRRGLLINLGGGVIGDMGGFAASCYKRGINFIQIPTTLLSQVDASVGGKLGVDFQFGKNIIGLFKNPGLVAINTGFLDTLSKEQIRNGFAELFKHALIKSADQWQEFMQLKSLMIPDIEDMVIRSVSIKKSIVEADPFEKNIRKILNFGHTLGHAVEAWSLENDKQPLMHGEAVVIGMIMESFLSTKYAGLAEGYLEEIVHALLTHYAYYPLQANLEEIWTYLQMDKKNDAGKVMSVLLKSPGNTIIDIPLSKQDVAEAMSFYKSLEGKYGAS